MSDSSLEIKNSILALASKTTPLALLDIRQKTKELVRLAGDEAAQVDLIEIFLTIMTDGTEIMNEILIETWGMLIDDGLWRARYDTKDEACRQLDSALLKDLRKRATTNRNRKEKYVKQI